MYEYTHIRVCAHMQRVRKAALYGTRAARNNAAITVRRRLFKGRPRIFSARFDFFRSKIKHSCFRTAYLFNTIVSPLRRRSARLAEIQQLPSSCTRSLYYKSVATHLI